MQEIIIGGQTIHKNSQIKIDIPLPNLYNMPSFLSVWAIRGKQDGPVVFVSAAVHGDELNGIEIIRRLKKAKVLKKLNGTLILVPIVNVYGLANLSRYLPDRRDLNRSFPGNTKGSLASRIASVFFNEIVKKCDLGIDLHTASIHKTNLPQIRTDINNEFTLNLAKAFRAPVVLHSELRDGSLRGCAKESGIPILLYEAGEALRFSEKSIKIGSRGILNILKELNMLPKKDSKKRGKAPIITKSSQWIRSSQSGILRTIKALGQTVQKGDIIAYIDEPLTDKSQAIEASFDGIIIGKSQIPLVYEGDAIFHIARFKDLEHAEERMEYFHEKSLNLDATDEIKEDSIR
ncbi:MAG: succinylglutamate desuccinylase [Proteobacteria bacterium]|nr:MAG: succinylglutamate desuccinylase [Pseudomonadota bacterium]